MRRYLLYFLLFCSLIFSVSCNKDKLKAPAAAFLVVDNVRLKTNFTNQGANSHKITDMWYYVDGEFKGVFPVGGVMPIVASGNVEITLFGGIMNNGISSTRVSYPAYQSKTFNLTVEPGKTYTVSPEFEYNSTTYFYYHDEFSSAGSYFKSVGDSNYVYTFDPSKTFGGTGGTDGSIYMSMSDAKPTAQMINTANYYLPPGGEVIYLELNYRCNQPFVVGIVGSNSDLTPGTDIREAVTVNPSDEWSKIYVSLTSIVSTPPNYQYYKIFIKAVKKTDQPQIYIDNVKLIYQ